MVTYLYLLSHVSELDNYLMDTLKKDSLVSDAFILREFERRFGTSVRRGRTDNYDDDAGPSQRDSHVS